MSKKQLKHLQKAREIKASKHKAITSDSILNTINDLIKSMDLSKQASSNSASNMINALINYQKVLKENEEQNNASNTIEPIVVKFVDAKTLESVLRILLLEQKVCSSRGEIAQNSDKLKEAIECLKLRIGVYSEILSLYEKNQYEEMLSVVERYANRLECDIDIF